MAKGRGAAGPTLTRRRCRDCGQSVAIPDGGPMTINKKVANRDLKIFMLSSWNTARCVSEP